MQDVYEDFSEVHAQGKWVCCDKPITYTRSGTKSKTFRKTKGLHEMFDLFQGLQVISKGFRNNTKYLNFRNYVKSLITLISCNICI